MKTIIKSDLDKVLIAVMGRWELVDKWWISENKHWNNSTPLEMYQGTEEERQSVISYVLSQISGEYL